MIRATQFSAMDGPLGDSWIWAYPQHWYMSVYTHNLYIGIIIFLQAQKWGYPLSWFVIEDGKSTSGVLG